MDTLDQAGLVVFVLGTAFLLYISRASLRSRGSHGFYRFFAWDGILALVLFNLEYWFDDPFSLRQVVSWFCLAVSLFLVIHGVRLLRAIGEPAVTRMDATLIGIEKTTTLVTVGAYKYIRHPLYSSLLFFTWGVFLKAPSWVGLALAVLATLFLTATARVEERENLEFFGAPYTGYIRQTRMFIPFVF